MKAELSSRFYGHFCHRNQITLPFLSPLSCPTSTLWDGSVPSHSLDTQSTCLFCGPLLLPEWQSCTRNGLEIHHSSNDKTSPLPGWKMRSEENGLAKAWQPAGCLPSEPCSRRSPVTAEQRAWWKHTLLRPDLFQLLCYLKEPTWDHKATGREIFINQ